MSLWKKCANVEQKPVLDMRQLVKRLQIVMAQSNVEVMQLAIQSMLEELSEHQRR